MLTRDSEDTRPPGRHVVVMLLENVSYPEDTRVRGEAQALVRAGHRVRVLAPRARAQPRHEWVAGVEVTRFWCPQSKRGSLGYISEYGVAHVQLISRAIAAAGKSTVLHAHNPPDSLALAAALITRPLDTKVVFDCHDLAPELFEERFSSETVASFLRATQRAAVRLADAVIVTNESQRDLLAEHTSSPEKIRIVRNGPLRETVGSVERGRPGQLRDPRIAFLGSLHEQDGVVALADVLALLRARPECAEATLLVVGDGRCRGRLEERVRELGLIEACTFTGQVPHEEVAPLLAEADICIDPAPCTPLNMRSTMVKIGEYLAIGRSVVAFDLVETRRTAESAALYAPCDDLEAFVSAIASLAVDPGLRADFEARALERAESVVWELSERVLLDIYERL